MSGAHYKHIHLKQTFTRAIIMFLSFGAVIFANTPSKGHGCDKSSSSTFATMALFGRFSAKKALRNGTNGTNGLAKR